MSVTSVNVIAEAGVNHNGDLDMAYRLVDSAKEAGADIVKFQTFKADRLATKSAPKAAYQTETTDKAESQYDMLKRLELSFEHHMALKDHCKTVGIEFLSTPFDRESVDLLVKELDLGLLKMPSGEITNAPLLLKAAQSGCDLILSTGMSSLEEVKQALQVVAFGLLNPNDVPTLEAMQQAFASEEGQAALKNKVSVLHCTTQYPAPFADVNLRAMATLRNEFGLKTGYSDHTAGISVPVAAVALGAEVIEKHFTLDKSLPGPDHKASLNPEELIAMVKAIREIELSLGSPDKGVTESEVENRKIARKSLVAVCDIKAGDVFTADNLAIKRPGTGVSPMRYWELLNTSAKKDFKEGEVIS